MLVLSEKMSEMQQIAVIVGERGGSNITFSSYSRKKMLAV